MTIKWMQHPKHGRFACTDSDIEMFRKSGWTEYVKPVIAKEEKAALAPKPPFASPKSTDLTREELVELAEQEGIEIDKRWSTQRIKDALGL